MIGWSAIFLQKLQRTTLRGWLLAAGALLRVAVSLFGAADRSAARRAQVTHMQRVYVVVGALQLSFIYE